MNSNEEKDLRGYDLRVDNFRNQLLQLINNSNLNISIIYYVIKDIYNILDNGFEKAVAQQYNEFRAAVQQQEEQEKTEEDKAE